MAKALDAPYFAGSRGASWLKIKQAHTLDLLVLAAEQDSYNNCCLIATIRELEAAAKTKQLPLELVVYPHADHGFNHAGRNYRGNDAADAWRRTGELLAKHHPVK